MKPHSIKYKVLTASIADLMAGRKYEEVARESGLSKGTLAYYIKKFGLKKPRANSRKTTEHERNNYNSQFTF